MTKQELNRDIKRLNKTITGAADGLSNTDYFAYIENAAKKEFLRLYHADSNFKYMNKANILIMFRPNLRHRFVALHQFGLNIEL